ncbi:MAG TPA: hypothetical protein VLL08_29245 [Kineosporiaceae bacterium]|nr:hypothetical protein [Kineosporiaceae bacterium]
MSWRDPAAPRTAALIGVIGAVLLGFSNQRLLHLASWTLDPTSPYSSGAWSTVIARWSPLAVVGLALATQIRTVRLYAGTALLAVGIFGFAAYLDIFWGVGPSQDLTANLGLTLHLLAALCVLAAGVITSAGTMSDPVARVPAGRGYLVRAAVTLIIVTTLSGILYALAEGSSLWTILAQGGPFLVYPITVWMLSRCLPRLAPAPAAGALLSIGVLVGLPQLHRLAGDAELFKFSFATLMFVDTQLIIAGLLLAASAPYFALSRQPVAVEPVVDEHVEPDTGSGVVDLREASDAQEGIVVHEGVDSHEDIGARDGAGIRETIDVRESARSLRSDHRPTRHLCRALHLNDDLLRRATQEVIDCPGRGIAPSFGIDLGTVVRHALLARRRMWLRDALLTSLSLLLLPQLTVLVITQNVDLLVPIAVSLLLGWLVGTVDRASRERIVAQQLSPEGFERHRQPQLTPAEERKIQAIQALDRGNVTAYGGYFPFVGSGSPIGGWSFALSVLKGRESLDGLRQTPHPFELAELYEAVRLEVEKLGIEGVHVEDRLYVDGEQAGLDPRFRTTGTPPHLIGSVSSDELDDLVRAPERINRVYRCLRIHGWGGEYVLSIYLNFTRTGRGLFAEARYFLLLPTRDEEHGRPQITAAARHSLRKSVPALIGAIPSAFRDLRDLSRTTEDERTPWGATTSLRELAQSRQYRRYFQQLDREMTSKIVERQLLDTITEFLRDRNIDTFEVEERQTAILNNGLIVSGGTVNAESLAVGTNSQSLLSRVSAAIKTPTEERSAS